MEILFGFELSVLIDQILKILKKFAIHDLEFMWQNIGTGPKTYRRKYHHPEPFDFKAKTPSRFSPYYMF